MSDTHPHPPSQGPEEQHATAPPPEPATVAIPRPLPPVWMRRAVIAVAVAMFVAGFVSTAMTPVLAAHYPAGLIALDTNIRNLMLARHVPLLPYVLLGASRRVLGATVMYLLGRWYGDAALRWFERHVGPSVRRGERFARVFGVPWVFLWPGPIVCVTTGAVGIPRLHFLVSVSAGAVALVLVCRFAGDQFSSQLDAVVGFFTRHMAETTALAVVIAIASALRAYRQVQLNNAADQRAAEELAAGELQATRSPSASSAKETSASSEPQSR